MSTIKPSKLQREMLLLMVQSSCSMLLFEDHCQLWKTPRQLRRELGELIVDGFVIQEESPRGRLYRLSLGSGADLARSIHAGAAT